MGGHSGNLRKYDVLLVADEVICGFGRTGSWFGSQTLGIEPDMMPVAKGLSSGYQPISACLVHERIAEVVGAHGEFFHGYTYSGHPVACAVALENIRIIEEEGLVERVRDDIGPYFQEKLQEMADHRLVGEVQGLGLLGAMELVADKKTATPFRHVGTIGTMTRDHSLDIGLEMRAVGDRMVLSPPLVISRDEVDELFEKARAAFDRLRQTSNADGGFMSATLEALGAELFWVERPSRLVEQVRRGGAAFGKRRGPHRTLLLLHGYTEFLEKYANEVFGRLRAMGFTVWSFDWRGQGLSTRPTRDPMRGHVLASTITLVRRRLSSGWWNEMGNVVLVGHSMGGHLGLRLLSEKPEPFAHAVVLSPMIGISTNCLPVSVARGLLALFNGLGLSERYPPGVAPTGPLDRRYEGNILTTDKDRFDAVRQTMRDNPALRIGSPTMGWAGAAFRSIATLSRPDYLARIGPSVLVRQRSGGR